MKNIVLLSILIGFSVYFSSCSKDGSVNLFSVQDDIAFGAQLDSTIVNTPSEYPLLSRKGNEEVYNYVEGIMNTILVSDNINYKDEFVWQVRIINQDVLNAFAAPGGYIYFYTGFLKYAESEAELAGVMAHEIAHVDHRHSTNRLTKLYGFQMLFSILLGKNPSQLAQITAQLAMGGTSLAFSRKDEYEADASSVEYITDIQNIRNYDPTAIVDFFDRMQDDSLSQADGSFEFLRTHPYDANRKENIFDIWKELGSPTGEKFMSEHEYIISRLP
ncbi:MAG: M48 family metalloprotease [Bacteroidota bacterium]